MDLELSSKQFTVYILKQFNLRGYALTSARAKLVGTPGIKDKHAFVYIETRASDS